MKDQYLTLSKPTLDSFIKELSGPAYIIMIERESPPFRSTHIRVTGLNEASIHMEYRSIYDTTFVDRGSETEKQINSDFDEIEKKLKEKGITVHPGYLGREIIQGKKERKHVQA
jgi:hypothetical protein